MADFTRHDKEDTVWSVLTSFAFHEDEEKSPKNRYFILDKNNAFIANDATDKAKAEVVCICIEAAFACNLQDFEVKISNNAVFDLLVLFGFENILIFDRDVKNSFELYCKGELFASGIFEEGKTIANIDIKILSELCKKDEYIPKSLVYAESGAEGMAYDICYNLRVNGCIIEMYNGDGDIKKATKYAQKDGHSAIVRCFADRTVEIKDFIKNEIIKTTVSEFLGYYQDEDEGCCGTHEHGHNDCDCGHHHN